jgi:hypothetical protein
MQHCNAEEAQDSPGKVRWQYAVSAAGYAVVAGKYPGTTVQTDVLPPSREGCIVV